MPLVISNTGPLLALVEIGQLELLRHLFEAIVIPPAVRAEILSEPALAAVQAALAVGWVSRPAPARPGGRARTAQRPRPRRKRSHCPGSGNRPGLAHSGRLGRPPPGR